MMGEGTVNDEELVEVMVGALREPPVEFITADKSWEYVMVEAALAAARSAGFQVFRPEDCDQTTVASELKDGSGYCRFGYQPAGVYSLVPADSGGSG